MEQRACRECDLIHEIPRLAVGATLRCRRCGAVLYRVRPNSIDRTLAWTFTGLILFGLALSFPFLALKTDVVIHHTSLLTGVSKLYAQQESFLAFVVLLTCVLIPLLQLFCLLYVFIPLKLNLRIRHARHVFRLFLQVKPWGMIEIYLLGILVAVVKLAKTATIVPGLAVLAFGLLVFSLTFAISSIDDHRVWDQLGDDR